MGYRKALKMIDWEYLVHRVFLFVIPPQVAVLLYRWITDLDFWNSPLSRNYSTFLIVGSTILILLSVVLLISMIKAREGISKKTSSRSWSRLPWCLRQSLVGLHCYRKFSCGFEFALCRLVTPADARPQVSVIPSKHKRPPLNETGVSISKFTDSQTTIH